MSRYSSSYDILSGGLTQLIKDLEDRKQKVKIVEYAITELVAEELVKEIQKEASTIDYKYDAYTSVYFNNVIRKTDKGHKVMNTSQQATYSEYGTGIIGEQTPHPDPKMNWGYDLNQHGEKGWVYQLPDGSWSRTNGLPSNPVYYRSAITVRSRIPYIIKKYLETEGT